MCMLNLMKSMVGQSFMTHVTVKHSLKTNLRTRKAMSLTLVEKTFNNELGCSLPFMLLLTRSVSLFC